MKIADILRQEVVIIGMTSPTGEAAVAQLVSALAKTRGVDAEGVRTGGAGIGQSLQVDIPNGAGATSFDAVRLTAIKVDLDVDSDNNNGFNTPDRSDVEEQYEDKEGDPDHPGKFVQVNDGDKDNDGIPDVADGFNAYSNEGMDSYQTTGEEFTPLVLEVPACIDPAKAKIRITYDGSGCGVTRTGYPPNYTYTPEPGKLRIWNCPGSTPRSPYGIDYSSGVGNFVQSGVAYAATRLRFDEYPVQIVYIEGIRASTALGDCRIVFEVDPCGNGNYMVADYVRVTAIRVGLNVDTDDDGDITARDDGSETNTLQDDPPGPYVNLNNDNDAARFQDPVPLQDRDTDGPIPAEDDLRHIPLSLEPDYLDTGTVTISRSNSKVRVWTSATKGADKKLLCDDAQKTWDLRNQGDRDALRPIKANLYAEGMELGECDITVVYKDNNGTEIARDQIKLTVCPGPPREMMNWGTMALIMAGGQLHCQWKHFSDADQQQPDKYKVYIETSPPNPDKNPFKRKIRPDLQPIVVDPEPDMAVRKGFIERTTTGKYLGGFSISFPEKADEGRTYWVLIRAVAGAQGYPSQNTTAYPVVIDYPDNGRSNVGNGVNFYVTECSDAQDVFWIEGGADTCPVCGNRDAPGSETMWRVAKTQLGGGGGEGYAGAYFADAGGLGGLVSACEGDQGIFAENKNKFGDWKDVDDNGKFYLLVTALANCGGYCWAAVDTLPPWNYLSDPWFNKSNYADLVYIDSASADDYRQSTAAHEIQHAIHYRWDATEKPWVNEGCSTYAEEVNHRGPTGFSSFGGYYEPDHVARAAKCSLTRFGRGMIWSRFRICPLCMKQEGEGQGGGPYNEEGYNIYYADYRKVALWTSYLDKVVGYQALKNMSTLVKDTAKGIAGVNNHAANPVLTAPDGPFVNWTIANYANRLEYAPAPYAYPDSAPWRAPRGGVTPVDKPIGGDYAWREELRDLAADYVKYTAQPPSGASSMAVYLKDVADWTKVVVSVILVSSSEEFIELVQPAPQTVQGEPGARRYEVDSTSFGYAVVVITNIDAGGAGEGREDDYRTRYSIKAVWE